MKMNIEKLTRKELVDLKAKVEKAITALDQKEKDAALKAAEQAARAHGFSLADLGVAGGKGRRKGAARGAKTPAKYRNPDDPSQTWSGRGRRPQWIKDAEAAGTDLATLMI